MNFNFIKLVPNGVNGKLANALNRVELVSEKNIGSGLRKSYQTIGRCNVLKPKTLRNPVTTVFAHVRKFLECYDKIFWI